MDDLQLFVFLFGYYLLSYLLLLLLLFGFFVLSFVFGCFFLFKGYFICFTYLGEYSIEVHFFLNLDA